GHTLAGFPHGFCGRAQPSSHLRCSLLTALAEAFSVASHSLRLGWIDPDGARRPSALPKHQPEGSKADQGDWQRVLANLAAQVRHELAAAVSKELGPRLIDDPAERQPLLQGVQRLAEIGSGALDLSFCMAWGLGHLTCSFNISASR